MPGMWLGASWHRLGSVEGWPELERELRRSCLMPRVPAGGRPAQGLRILGRGEGLKPLGTTKSGFKPQGSLWSGKENAGWALCLSHGMCK